MSTVGHESEHRSPLFISSDRIQRERLKAISELAELRDSSGTTDGDGGKRGLLRRNGVQTGRRRDHAARPPAQEIGDASGTREALGC